MRRAKAGEHDAPVPIVRTKSLRLRGKLKTRMPRRVLELSHTVAGFYPSLAYESWRIDPELRFADSVGKLKVVAFYEVDNTLAALLTGPTSRRAAPEDAARFGMTAATAVAVVRFYKGEAPKWVVDTEAATPPASARLRLTPDIKAAWERMKEGR